MNDLPNPPAPNVPMVEPGAPRSMFQTWIDAVTKPSERTFAAIASAPNASTTNAIIWVAIGSVISSFLSLVAPNTGLQDLRRVLEQQGIDNQFINSLGTGGGGFGTKIFQFVCGIPIGVIFAVVFFLIGVALILWVARMFGGHGSFDKLAYTFAAIAAPMAVVSGLLALLGAIPYVGFCFGLLGLAVVIYSIVLQIMAAKAVNGFASWGPAIGSVLIPGLAIGLICCCLAFGISALIGASLGNVFSSINNSLVP
jgi:Yip1-like protein